ncbi:MAG TPA: hypothetical protein VL156_13615 [Terriglobales bacterium]|jgi:hypothetical protein|nr:hypothetical protein [Terriglobales bacterium]
MRWGNEKGLKVGIAGALATVALGLGVRLIAGSHMSFSPPISENYTRDRGKEFRVGKTANLLSLLKSKRLELSENTEYEGTGRNLFRPEIPVLRTRPRLTPPHEVPQAHHFPPTIRLKFFGFAVTAGAGKQIFLSEDGEVFIGREGDIVNRRYKVLQIRPASVEIEDLIDEVQQILPLDQG